MLDPSSKADIVRFYFHTVGDNVKAKMKEMRQYLGNYYLEYEKGHKETQFALVYIPFDGHTLSEATHESGLSCLGKSQIEFASQNSSAHAERSELDSYLEDHRVFVREDKKFNVLAW